MPSTNSYMITDVPRSVLIPGFEIALDELMRVHGHPAVTHAVVTNVMVDNERQRITIWDDNIDQPANGWWPNGVHTLAYAEFMAHARTSRASRGTVLMADFLAQGWALANAQKVGK